MEPPRLSFLPFIQTWDNVNEILNLNLLVVPVGDPRLPLNAALPSSPPAPAFAGSTITLQVHISAVPDLLPTIADVPPGANSYALTMPLPQTAIFDELAAQFSITLPQTAFERGPAFRLRKYLPQDYRQAFAFVAPKTELAVMDDSYFCALKCPPATPPSPTPPSPDISWGEAFAMLLRQPDVARAAGLIHSLKVPISGGIDGGWIFFTLARGSDFAAQAAADVTYARYFSSRLPKLETTTTRPIFTAVSFPVAADAAGVSAFGALDEVFPEAVAFDDGFTKIVHARQPRTADITNDSETGPPIQIDPGIQLGWDDEDVLIGMNRGVGANLDDSLPPEAPSGVFGYRIDVRPTSSTTWTSLCRVQAKALTFGSTTFPNFTTELSVEVHPSQLGNQFWVPSYFSRWIGGSLVARTDSEQMLAGPARDTPTPFTPLDAATVPLRYGQTYDFRARLADHTGGGPAHTETPFRDAQAPIATLAMRRFISLQQVQVGVIPPVSGPPVQFSIRRPNISFPQAVFTGFPGAFAYLEAIAQANQTRLPTAQQLVAMPDPDATYLEISVQVEMPSFDPSGGRSGFRQLFKTYRSFPALIDLNAEVPLLLELEWIDAQRLEDISWEMPTTPMNGTTGPVQVPRGRNVKVDVRAIGQMDLNYFGSPQSRLGQTVELWTGHLRVPSVSEPPLFATVSPQEALTSVFLQPDPLTAAPTQAAPTQFTPSPLLAKRLATVLELFEENGTLFAPPGRRIVFGCQGLKHHLAPDSSSLTFTNRAELAQTWINVLRLPVERDWSWIGLATPAFQMTRRIELVTTGTVRTLSLGSVSVNHAVNQQAVQGQSQRDSFDLIFVDAFEPPLGNDGFPYEVLLSYDVTVFFENGTTQTLSQTTHLPVSTSPQTAPKIISAGHALSPYTIIDDYAETGERERLLWLEFEEDPRQDPRDIVYCRVLAISPDPLLMRYFEPLADPATAAELDIDPETIRVITPGQADDFAGLSAMQPLIRATDSDRHFAVPLPPNLSANSPELFGFFTYEFRIGHPRGTQSAPFWSTAQARFGPPIVIEGVQHPAPSLRCSVRRLGLSFLASSRYAQPVVNGRRVQLLPPHTELWFVLYARVMQADGSTHRNIQIDLRRATVDQTETSGTRDSTGTARWSLTEVRNRLELFRLDPSTPSSILAIELLPEPNGAFDDPLGGDLGQVRILRLSRLVSLPKDCCVDTVSP